MSDIIRPDGQPAREPNSGEPRPSNKEVLSFIEKQRQEQEGDEIADKIINMHDQEANTETVERRKKQLAVAAQIVMVQLDGDSQLLEAVAKEPGTTLPDRHEKMQLARCFRVTMGWLQGLVATQQVVDNAKDQNPENQ